MHPVRALYARFEMLIHELAKFGIIGTLGFVIDFAIFNALHHGGGLGPLTANTISSLTAAVFTYLGNRLWSFRHKAKQSMRKEIPVFAVLNLVGLVITEAFIAFGFYVLSAHSPAATNAAKLLGTAVATLFRFATYKKFVFVGDDVRLSDPEQAHILDAESIVQV